MFEALALGSGNNPDRLLTISELKSDGFWYLATPYSNYEGGIERAFEDACAVAGALLAAGVHVYCPIAHTHPIATHGNLDHFSHDLFLPFDEKMMAAATGCLVALMPGWDESRGVLHEIQWFEARNRPVIHLRYPLERA